MMVSACNYIAAALLERFPLVTSTIGKRESALLKMRLNDVEIDRPIFICGLPRSGSTKILEILNRHPDTESLQYDDFPYLFIPYLWNRFLKRFLVRKLEPVERIHEDRILVTPESPDSFEEVLWINNFEGCHEPNRSHVITNETTNARFEKTYRDFIKKFLLGRGGSRYLSKAHYNSTRIEYLLKMFPDARFIVPIRSPVSQVGSMVDDFAKSHQRAPRGAPKSMTYSVSH